ncbi:ATP-binding cassette domain-containing protein [uncultured Treponema sp.]|uniref:ATP-binding cassette domain-containing protein n=1 Tax=uncultured Treponema sp. TaxID=162155 RepID=UPI0025FF6AAA|nr:ATP-binding cassette domain-containing protein [uncultured Treponema sp.]
MALFRIEDVKFNSRSKEVIRGISLDIEAGTVTGLMGRSGSGKSTLLKLIAGILVPSGGRVLYKNIDIQLMNDKRNMRFRRECSFVFQDSALWANQDIAQNLNLPLQTQNPSMSESERKQRIHEVCELVKYERPLNLRPVDLSMGEQKRIAFARALINRPEVLFLDECTESLDKKGGAVILDLLHDFIAAGNTVVYVSHSTSFISAIGGDKYVIDEGLLSD